MCIKLIRGDSVDTLASLPANFYDIVFTDPPYNIGINYGYGAEKDSVSQDEFHTWLCRWLTDCARVLKPTGSIFVLINHENAPCVHKRLEQLELNWRNTIIWNETFGTNCVKKFNRTTRQILYFTKSKAFYFNASSPHIRQSSARLTKYSDSRANPSGKILDDLWSIPRICGTHAERVPEVPTQIPLEIVRRCVAAALPSGKAEILDPFCGSGTTGCVAKEFGANFTGLELNPKYLEIAAKRIESYEKL